MGGKCGDLKRVVMGLDKVKRTPCGFCFVEYYTRDSAANAMRWINGTRLEDRTDYDPGRGGYGKRNEDAANRKRKMMRDSEKYERAEENSKRRRRNSGSD